MRDSIATSRNRRCSLSAAALAAVLLWGAGPSAQAQGTVPAEVGVDEKLGAQAALNSVLTDEDGQPITLRELVDKPTILTLNFLTCTGICSPQLNALATALNQVGLEPGKDFQVVSVSFDPSDTPAVAHDKRLSYLKLMKPDFPPQAWRFVTGSAKATKTVTDSVGFRFRAVASGFAHPGVAVVLSPRGIVSRYLYGVRFLPADLEMAIREAAAEQVRPTISRVLAFCYSYDPQSRSYVLSLTRLTGTVVLLFAAGFLIFLLKGKSLRNQEKARLAR
jgi:protein SCO1/2